MDGMILFDLTLVMNLGHWIFALASKMLALPPQYMLDMVKRQKEKPVQVMIMHLIRWSLESGVTLCGMLTMIGGSVQRAP